jgi:site-specific DNA-adenine methylase
MTKTRDLLVRTGEIIRLPSPPLGGWPRKLNPNLDPRKFVPTFGYDGSKANLAKFIVLLLPPSGKRFVEPFAGRGNVCWRVAQRLEYKRFWINDKTMDRFFKALRDFTNVPPDWGMDTFNRLKEAHMAGKKMAEIPVAVGTNGEVGAYIEVSTDVMEQALVFSGNPWKKAGRKTRQKPPDTFRYQLKYLVTNQIMWRTKPRVTNWDFMKVLDQCGPEDVVYLDPPYRTAKVNYKPLTDEQYKEMVRALRRAKFRWLLSEYEEDIYRPLGEPIRITVKKCTDNSNHTGAKRQDKVECLWSNFIPENVVTRFKELHIAGQRVGIKAAINTLNWIEETNNKHLAAKTATPD